MDPKSPEPKVEAKSVKQQIKELNDSCKQLKTACSTSEPLEVQPKTTACETPKAGHSRSGLKGSGTKVAATGATASAVHMKQIGSNSKDLVNKLTQTLKRNSCAQQLIIGSLSGWTTGFMTMKVGKTAAFAIGGGIIAFQIAQHQGWVATDWDKVAEKVKGTTKKFGNVGEKPWVTNVSKFAKTNRCFTAGFVGGFLIGLAT